MPPFNVMSSSFRPKWVQVMLSVCTQVWDHSPEHWQTIRSLTPEKSMSFLSPPAAVNCHNLHLGTWPCESFSYPCKNVDWQDLVQLLCRWSQLLWIYEINGSLSPEDTISQKVFTINHFTPPPMMVPEQFRVGMT